MRSRAGVACGLLLLVLAGGCAGARPGADAVSEYAVGSRGAPGSAPSASAAPSVAVASGASGVSGTAASGTEASGTAGPVGATEAAARALVRGVVSTLIGGDWAGYRRLWSAGDRELVSEPDIVRYLAACSTPGLPVEASELRVSGSIGVVRLDVAGTVETHRLLFEDGRWRWRISDTERRRLARGVDTLLAEGTADGTCRP